MPGVTTRAVSKYGLVCSLPEFVAPAAPGKGDPGFEATTVVWVSEAAGEASYVHQEGPKGHEERHGKTLFETFVPSCRCGYLLGKSPFSMTPPFFAYRLLCYTAGICHLCEATPDQIS